MKITAEDMYILFDSITAISSLAEIFSYKPNERNTPNTAYIYFDCRNSTNTIVDNKGYIADICTVVVYIVAPETSTTAPEAVVDTISSVIDENLLQNGCSQLEAINGKRVLSVRSSSESPIGYDIKNRAIRSKTYSILYEQL